MFVDSHCHLDFPEFAGRIEQLLERMQASQVTHALCISVTAPEFPNVLALAEQHDNLYASVGVHPDYVDTVEPSVDWLVEQARHPRIVAIGETGLDYFRIEGDPHWQRERFRVHIRAARRAGKPLVIHTRAAADDTLRIMREEGADTVGGVMHCFTESTAVAEQALALGFMISFSGIVTFKNAAALRDTARQVPDDRLLIETDSPYLAPVPHRGKTNEPSFVPHVAACLAELRGTTAQRIGEITTSNFFRLFNMIDDTPKVNY